MTIKKKLAPYFTNTQKNLLLSFCFIFIITVSQAFSEAKFTAIKKTLPNWVVTKMKRHSWREGCPVPLKNLKY